MSQDVATASVTVSLVRYKNTHSFTDGCSRVAIPSQCVRTQSEQNYAGQISKNYYIHQVKSIWVSGFYFLCKSTDVSVMYCAVETNIVM